jgi:hypothetical protein
MKKNNTMVTVPSAYVTKTKQRIKQYDNTVYLKNGDEFEIELFNPTQNKVLAKIEINSTTIGGSGIVLRPGERVFLERYINEAKKFLFETYKVSGTNSDVLRAIKNNGDIVVRFYQEQTLPAINLNQWPAPIVYNPWPTYWDNGIKYYTSPHYVNPFGCFGGTLTTTNSSVGHCSSSGVAGAGGGSGINVGNTTSNNAFYCNSSLSNPTMDSMSFTSSVTPILGKHKNTKGLRKLTLDSQKEIETGRVEMGSNSNQSFTYDYSKFNSYHSWISTWKILPESQREMVIEDLSIFCTGCGAKRKKQSHLFCPICGSKY